MGEGSSDFGMDPSSTEEWCDKLPPGWATEYQNQRKVYLTPAPRRIKIDCRAKLIELQRHGRFTEMKVEDLSFGTKRKRKV